MSIPAVIRICFVAFVGSAVATDYCSTTICNAGVKHIACGNSGKFVSTCPANAAMVTLNPTLKTIIVTGHNVKRNLIAGGVVLNHKPACRMATMQWDNELANVASFNVRQCAMRHDKCRNTNAFKYSGQNLAWMTFYGTPNYANLFQNAINMWYKEVKYSNMTYIKSYPSNYKGPDIGHFTVMMADRNIRVGCAAATYSVKGATSKAFLVACNYATTNMINFPIYANCAKAGTSCTTGKNAKYTHLCSTKEVYNVNKWF